MLRAAACRFMLFFGWICYARFASACIDQWRHGPHHADCFDVLTIVQVGMSQRVKGVDHAMDSISIREVLQDVL